METVKKHKYDMMKDIVKCPQCGGNEYYGHLVMRDGRNYCRKCIYDLWTTESYQAAKHREDIDAAKYDRKPLYDRMSYWRPTEKDKVFPIYEDGKDYSVEVENYEEE